MSAASAACRVLSGYRRLIRAQKKLFAEDIYAQSQAKIAIRDYFEQNRSIADTKQLSELMQAIDDAEDMLVHGIAQGKLNEHTGSYEVKVKPEHTKPHTDSGGEGVVVETHKSTEKR